MKPEKYIGMDVHQATISVAVLDDRGKLIMECILETKAATMVEFLKGLQGSLSVTFEEGTSAAWLHDLLKPHVRTIEEESLTSWAQPKLQSRSQEPVQRRGPPGVSPTWSLARVLRRAAGQRNPARDGATDLGAKNGRDYFNHVGERSKGHPVGVVV